MVVPFKKMFEAAKRLHDIGDDVTACNGKVPVLKWGGTDGPRASFEELAEQGVRSVRVARE